MILLPSSITACIAAAVELTMPLSLLVPTRPARPPTRPFSRPVIRPLTILRPARLGALRICVDLEAIISILLSASDLLYTIFTRRTV